MSLLLKESKGSSFYDPKNFQTIQNPYPSYQALRSNHPIYWHPELKCWMLTRYQDISKMVRDQRFSVQIIDQVVNKMPQQNQEKLQFAKERSKNSFLFMDPPEHSRMRRLVSNAFAAKKVQDLRTLVQDITHQIFDKALEFRKNNNYPAIDLIDDFATPLPFLVVAQILGVPSQDRPQLKEWSDTAALFLGKPLLSLEECEEIKNASQAIDQYFKEIFRQRRMHPQDDLISELIQAKDQGDQLNENELSSTCGLLLIAGHETTTNLIGNGMLAFLENPLQWEKIQTNKELIPRAVHEVLRFDGAVQYIQRVLKEDVLFEGHLLKEGQHVMAFVGAAGRDPEVFKDPDLFDIERSNAHMHLTFGSSIHFCLGAHLARLEGEIAFEFLSEKFSKLKLSEHFEKPIFRDNMALRGLKHLWVEL